MTEINDINMSRKLQAAEKTAKNKVLETAEDFATVLDQAMVDTHDSVLNQERNALKKKAKNKSAKNNTAEIFIAPVQANKADIIKQNKPEQNLSAKANFKNLKIIDSQNNSAEKNNSDQPTAINISGSPKNIFAVDEKNNMVLPVFARADKNLENLISKINNPANVEFKDLFNELVKEVKTRRDGDLTHLKLVLQPEELGELDVSFVLVNKKLQVSITASSETKELLQKNEAELRNILQNNGYSLMELNFNTQGSPNRENATYELQNNNGYGSVENSGQNTLNIADKNDIIYKINNLLSQLIINYVA